MRAPAPTTSRKWLSRLSSAQTAPAEPPSAATVWLHVGMTVEIREILRSGSVSATAIALCRPAPPPPTITMSV